MENRREAKETGSQAGDQAERREPAPPAPQAFAAAPGTNAAMSQPAVASDGQLVEFGYGHGV